MNAVPDIFRRDHRGRFVSNREAFNAYSDSLRMAPARDAMHQLRRVLASMARAADHYGSANPDMPPGFQAIIVFGKRVPDDITPEAALALLTPRRTLH